MIFGNFHSGTCFNRLKTASTTRRQSHHPPFRAIQSIAVLLFVILSLFGTYVECRTLSNGEDVGIFITRHIQEYQVMVFSKSYCPHCKQTKATFARVLQQVQMDNQEISVQMMDLDELPGNDGALIQNELAYLTGQRTVPNVFIGGVHIGGNTDVQDLLRSGTLQEMIQKASFAEEF